MPLSAGRLLGGCVGLKWMEANVLLKGSLSGDKGRISWAQQAYSSSSNYRTEGGRGAGLGGLTELAPSQPCCLLVIVARVPPWLCCLVC